VTLAAALFSPINRELFNMMSEGKTSRLPAPKQMLIMRSTVEQAAETIEQGLGFYNPKNGNLVRLQTPFVRAWMQPQDDAIKTVVGVAALPIMLPGKRLIGHDCPPDLVPDYGPWFDERSGLVFDVPDELIAHLPKRGQARRGAVARAMRFLTDVWLVDVATDYRGKCVLIALACTVIERFLLPSRPAFFLAAGRAATGKTTTVQMISMVVTGKAGAGSPLANREEERQKAVLSYLSAGLAMICWDNIAEGTQITSPALEAALTSDYYADRLLGFSEIRTVATSSVQTFTGNNIGPKSDMASRALQARFTVNRPDPENRKFTRLHPVKWTEDHRGEILGALYTILLGNPDISEGSQTPTRFKEWYELVGSAVEHAALMHQTSVDAVGGLDHCLPRPVSFKALFGESRADDEKDTTLAELLVALMDKWPDGAAAADITGHIRDFDNPRQRDDTIGPVALYGLIGTATRGWGHISRENVNPQMVTSRLKQVLATTVETVAGEWLQLRYMAAQDHHNPGKFSVNTVVPSPAAQADFDVELVQPEVIDTMQQMGDGG
jgi:hypothetical protein